MIAEYKCLNGSGWFDACDQASRYCADKGIDQPIMVSIIRGENIGFFLYKHGYHYTAQFRNKALDGFLAAYPNNFGINIIPQSNDMGTPAKIFHVKNDYSKIHFMLKYIAALSEIPEVIFDQEHINKNMPITLSHSSLDQGKNITFGKTIPSNTQSKILKMVIESNKVKII